MGYKIPNANHPWRQYANRKEPDDKKIKITKSVRVFVDEIVDNWENISVTSYKDTERHFLPDLTSDKQAMWLINLIKKVYIKNTDFNEYD